MCSGLTLGALLPLKLIGVEGEVQLPPEYGSVVRVDQLKHTLVDHVRLRGGSKTDRSTERLEHQASGCEVGREDDDNTIFTVVLIYRGLDMRWMNCQKHKSCFL